MGAQSVTGVGKGSADRLNAVKLESLVHAPTIIFTGISDSKITGFTSPPSIGNTVYFPYALPGGPDKYVVLITSLNSGSVYLTDRLENDNEEFIGFTFNAAAAGQIMYMVAKIGTKPT